MRWHAGLLCALLAGPPVLVADIELTQADGTALILPAAAQSLVTLSPHLAELAFAAGAGKRLLATVEYSEYPPTAAELLRVGDAFRLDVERIVALRPDLVIAWESGNPQAALEQLERLGLRVWYVEIREPAQIAAVIDSIGRAVGDTRVAAQAAAVLRTRLRALSERYRGARELRYFYQVAARPLFTINGEHLISKGLALCGGVNIFERESGLAFPVTHEAVIGADPEAIFAPSLDNQAAPLDEWLSWPGMQAVRNEALFLLPADEISRATPRWLDSTEQACSLMQGLRERSDDGQQPD
ncbi:MAG: cobalamin-binding protein [Xanthomonadales bacterium]|nr:cobalamin-binding protein [Xanthomonadales bacterium]